MKLLRKQFYLWLVPQDNGRVLKINISMRHIFATVLVALTLPLSIFIFSDSLTFSSLTSEANTSKHPKFFRNIEIARNRALAERDKFAEQTDNLKILSERVQRYESDIRSKVEELASVLEAATSIGLELESSRSTTDQVAQNSESKGVGGLEIDCDDINAEECKFEVLEASEGPDLDFLKALHNSVSSSESLTSQLDTVIKELKHIPLGFPVGGEITSGFGFRVSPFSRKVKLHQGVDFALPFGSYIYATADGVISKVERNGTYGNVIDIKHKKGIVTRYAHLSKAMVKPGTKVKRGDIIGHVGSTGRSTGPHLHYEIRINGKAKNPGKFMELAYRLNTIL